MILHDYKEVLNSKLIIDPNSYERSWVFYLKQYITALSCLLNISRRGNYLTNFRYMAFLFLMRHSLELLLKYLLEKSGKLNCSAVLGTHNLKAIALELGLDISTFIEEFDCLQPNSKGDCFRYITDHKGNRYFNSGILDCFDTCQHFILFFNRHRPEGMDYISLLEDNKFMRNEFCFHVTECRTLGTITTHFDETIYELISRVNNNELSVNDIYLPLLCLIRHSLELYLKYSLMNIGDELLDKDIITNTHSLEKLWEIYSYHIGKAVENIKNEDTFKEQSMNMFLKAKSFNEIMHSLDANSLNFRFPKSKKGHVHNFVPKPNSLELIFNLYCESNSFLCFAVEVLFEAGYLKVGDDIICSLME